MNQLSFIELPITGSEPARCVDGRPSTDLTQGGQMLGGSIHPIFLLAVTQGIPFDEQLVRQTLQILEKEGYATGIHRGTQQSKELGTSDCGFADNLRVIFETAVSQKSEITKRICAIYTNPDIIAQSFPLLEKYAPDQITVFKEQLIASMERIGATIEHTQGVHKEEIAFVNLTPHTTLDLRTIHQDGKQAFNLDLWFAVEQAAKLGIAREITTGLSLILYQAAAIVLIENAGQPAIPVVIR